jgi:hypothetical protein
MLTLPLATRVLVSLFARQESFRNMGIFPQAWVNGRAEMDTPLPALVASHEA